MKIIRLCLFSALLSSVAFAADTIPLQFNAVLKAGKDNRYGLSTAAGTHSEWLALGQTFEGYTLKDFDDKSSTLVLEHEGQPVRLPLANGTISTAAAATPATLADATAVIDQMHFEEMIKKSVEQQQKSMAAMMRKMGGAKGLANDPDFEAHQAKMMDMMMQALDPKALKSDMSRIYSELFTKEELAAMGDFYSTPAGQSLINKQPEVQQKLNETIMPRLMGVMPKIQQMTAEWAKQRAAAAKAAADASAASAAASTPTVPAPAAAVPAEQKK